MSRIPPHTTNDEDLLGHLAMRFRGTRQLEERQSLAKEYGAAVARLIASGNWHEVPPFEDQLPDAWMPQAFFEYWDN